MQAARATFQRLVEADGSDPQQWVNLALACQNLKDEAGEESAITRALTPATRRLTARSPR